MPTTDPDKKRAQAARWRERNRQYIRDKAKAWRLRTGRTGNARVGKGTGAETFRNDLSDPRHGTENGYGNLKCRCPRCTDAHNIYHQAYMTKRRNR